MVRLLVTSQWNNRITLRPPNYSLLFQHVESVKRMNKMKSLHVYPHNFISSIHLCFFKKKTKQKCATGKKNTSVPYTIKIYTEYLMNWENVLAF
jgi:hypothetical protein